MCFADYLDVSGIIFPVGTMSCQQYDTFIEKLCAVLYCAEHARKRWKPNAGSENDMRTIRNLEEKSVHAYCETVNINRLFFTCNPVNHLCQKLLSHNTYSCKPALQVIAARTRQRRVAVRGGLDHYC